jgi:murein DD-endopeptidase MepM/ murein hydrolase activator NlpD
MRRLVPALLLALVLVTPALADDGTKKQRVDSRISSLQGKLAAQKVRENSLRGEVADYTRRIRALEAQVGDVSLRLHTLEADLALHERRLDALTALFTLQTNRFAFLQEQYRLAVQVLEQRVVQAYESDDLSTIEVVLGAGSIKDAIDRVEYVQEVAAQDRSIIAQVTAARRQVAGARARTRRLRTAVRGETSVIASRTAQTRSVRDELVGARDDLASSRRERLVDLSTLSAAERGEASEIDALQAVSRTLGARIRAAQSGGNEPSSVPSSSGLIWPVQGPITSPFGWRWGRMHEGIDIGVPYGTPIRAAAAGTVIYCGWEEGYGNLVVVDHGGGLATAYAHQSSIATSCGAQVAQGQVIGYVGCTGHCFGPHLHFEVRVNGNPVDPLGYL